MLPCLTVGLLALAAPFGTAQEEGRPAEKIPVAPKPEQPAEAAPAPLVVPAPACDHAPPVDKILWTERKCPLSVLEAREVPVEEKRPTFELTFKTETRKFTEYVIKERKVKREVPYTDLVPETETDPHTGHCTTVLKPCAKVKVVESVEFYSAPVEREVVVEIPYLKPAEETVTRKTIIFEWKTVYNKEDCAIRVPGTEVLKDQHFISPKNCLPNVETHPHP
jgi:hypothetical protein